MGGGVLSGLQIWNHQFCTYKELFSVRNVHQKLSQFMEFLAFRVRPPLSLGKMSLHKMKRKKKWQVGRHCTGICESGQGREVREPEMLNLYFQGNDLQSTVASKIRPKRQGTFSVFSASLNNAERGLSIHLEPKDFQDMVVFDLFFCPLHTITHPTTPGVLFVITACL